MSRDWTPDELQKASEIMKANGLTDTVIHKDMVLKIPTKPSYEEIGKAFEKALNELDNLKSVQELYEMIGD